MSFVPGFADREAADQRRAAFANREAIAYLIRALQEVRVRASSRQQ